MEKKLIGKPKFYHQLCIQGCAANIKAKNRLKTFELFAPCEINHFTKNEILSFFFKSSPNKSE